MRPPLAPRRSLRRPLLGLAGVFALALASCAPSSSEESQLGLEAAVSVRPRVVMDGLIELSARTEGRLFVDEVVFHAPGVQIRNDSQTIADLLASDPLDQGAMFFLYDLASPGGAGALGGERRWNLQQPGITPDSQVVFSFSPLEASPERLEALQTRSGYDLAPLNGYTAYIHGYLSTSGGMLSSFAELSGDPEGDPADGTAASGDPEGDPLSGDPEGDPAAPGGNGPDSEAQGAPYPKTTHPAVRGRPALRGDELVPFIVVVSTELNLAVPLLDLGYADLDPGEYLPVDLHVDLDRLFSEERLEDLDAEATRAGDSGAVLQVGDREVRGLFGLKLRRVGVKVSSEEEHRIRIEGDPRGQ